MKATVQAMAIAGLGMALAGEAWADHASFESFQKSRAHFERLMQSCINQSPEPAFAEMWCSEAFSNTWSRDLSGGEDVADHTLTITNPGVVDITFTATGRDEAGTKAGRTAACYRLPGASR